MRCVVLESPLAGDVAENVKYARAAARHCLLRGDAPFASHLLYAQEGVLDDLDKEQRSLGMQAGFAWSIRAEASCVYLDRGMSSGMISGIARVARVEIPIEFYTLRPELVVSNISVTPGGMLLLDETDRRLLLQKRDASFI